MEFLMVSRVLPNNRKIGKYSDKRIKKDMEKCRKMSAHDCDTDIDKG